MAAIDFPSSPTVGQTFTSNGKTFRWSGTSWQNVSAGYTGSAGLSPWTTISANYTAVDKDRLMLDNTAGEFYITLPLNPASGEYLQVTDAGNLAVNSVIVDPNGSTIEGLPDSLLLNIPNSTTEFIFDGNTWQLTSTAGPQGEIGYTGSVGGIGYTGSIGNIGYTGSQGLWADLDSVSANLIPAADVTYDLGNVSYRWRDLYLSGNTINLGNATISSSNTAVVLPADSKIGNVAIASQEFVSSTVTSSVPTFVANSSAPTNPTLGDFWFSTTKNALYQYANLGYNQYWLAITGNPVTFGVSNATTSSISESNLYPTYVEYLIAAGGGGAGPWATGGGGGGGFLEGTTSIGAGTYAVTVGAGGATATSKYSGGQSGTNSAFVLDVVNLTAIGGGGGASYLTGNPAKSGGSGGGGSGRHPAGGLGTPGQGYAGGIGMMWNQGSGSGGGGGAAGVGGNATATTYGLGGPGLSRDITGSAITYSSGGQGNRYENYEKAKNGAPNTGQGAGAAGGGGTGGSGVVVLRYPDSYPEPYATTGSPTVTVANGYRTYVFTASGTISFFVTG